MFQIKITSKRIVYLRARGMFPLQLCPSITTCSSALEVGATQVRSPCISCIGNMKRNCRIVVTRRKGAVDSVLKFVGYSLCYSRAPNAAEQVRRIGDECV